VTAPLKWALLGASDIAATRMIPAMRALGHSVEVACSSSAERADAFAQAHGIPRATATLEQALDAPIDAVYVSSYNELHYSQTMAALAAGKHVLTEKPMALSIEDAESMAAAAEIAGLVLAVNHHLPFSPVHRVARELVDSGAIGRVLSARIAHAVLLPERLRGWRVDDVRGGGVALDITCHDASVLNPLLGRATRVAAIGVTQAPWNAGAASDAVMTVIEYEKDGHRVIAQTHDAFSVAFEQTSFTVHGTEGTLVGRNAMTQDSVGSLELIDADGSRPVPLSLGRDLYEIILTAFAGATAGTGQPTVSGRDGVETLRVALAVLEASATGRTIDLH
jgi:1,5-anhydro-D-fructose reductase (1,5-anhydro-D-mannitol-forming)